MSRRLDPGPEDRDDAESFSEGVDDIYGKDDEDEEDEEDECSG